VLSLWSSQKLALKQGLEKEAYVKMKRGMVLYSHHSTDQPSPPSVAHA